MCFGDDARPPLPPVRGGAVDSDDLVLTSADGTDFSSFFAHPDQRSGTGIVILPDVIGSMSAPLLLLAAGQDHTPVADVEAFAGRVRAAGTETELHVYPDAVHSFFDRRFEDHRDDCDDAWRRMLDFMTRHTAA